MDSSRSLHIAMYPWLAMGHQTAFLHLCNKLAKRGQRISFITPKSAQAILEPFNLHPDLITFVPITVPHVEGLPPNAETTADVPYPLQPHIMTAMDLTKDEIETFISDLKPDLIFYDFTHWMPPLAKRLGIKCVHYCTASSVMLAYTLTPARYYQGNDLSESELMEPPEGYPDASIKLHAHEARAFASKRKDTFGSNVLFYDRQFIALKEADVLAYRTCREIEGPYMDYLGKQFNKPVLASGPVILDPPTSDLEEKFATWLGGFEPGSVVYCCFGSECTLRSNQFQELLLGLELTGMPFLAAVKPPSGFESVEAAMPEGFEERVQGRGFVYGGWVLQQLILAHPSLGCFITHCGSGSLSEALVNNCQLVLLPNVGDQILNARMMGNNLQVGVEVEKDDDGMYSKESVCKAVSIVMDDENETSKKVRDNHTRLREMLLHKDLESSYVDNFCKQLQDIVDGKDLLTVDSNADSAE
ncbi:UDP-glycosyltransferase 79B30-like [Abrus precatorius]|uniref:Glycosyltransferase n=1 Tax=Abrus precatorius TaxID=3816 RepID=A0A8B8KZP4_ABRPR|nr:UDP-glycosyltransferase 79B30-like [Abrus precatorius]